MSRMEVLESIGIQGNRTVTIVLAKNQKRIERRLEVKSVRFPRTILIMIILCLMFTACSLNPTQGVTTTSPTTSPTTSSTTSSSASPTTTATQTTQTTAPMELDILGQGAWSIPYEEWTNYPTYNAMADLFVQAGLKLNFEVITREQYPTVVQTRMAAGVDLPDIVNLSPLDTTTALNLAEQGIILDVKPLLKEFGSGSIEKFWEDYKFALKLSTAPNGSVYWFVGFSRFEIESKPGTLAYSTLAPQIRLDWLEKTALKPPASIEEFKNCLETFRKEDCNGSGVEDEIMLFDPTSFQNGVAQWFGLVPEVSYTNLENGKVMSPWLQDGIDEYFAYAKSLVDAELIDVSLIGAPWEQIEQKTLDNKVSSFYGYTLESREAQMTDIEGAKYQSVDPLQAVAGITPAVVAETSEIILGSWGITRDCQDKKAAIRFFEVVFSPEYCQLDAWGREGEEFEIRDGVKHMTEKFGRWEQTATGDMLALGRSFTDSVLPWVQNLSLEGQLDGIEEYKKVWQLKYNDYHPRFCGGNQLALPDFEQANRKAELFNNISTYSSESASKLATGDIPLSELPKVIAELKNLGLEELMQIDQVLFDKYNSN